MRFVLFGLLTTVVVTDVIEFPQIDERNKEPMKALMSYETGDILTIGREGSPGVRARFEFAFDLAEYAPGVRLIFPDSGRYRHGDDFESIAFGFGEGS